MNLFKLFRSALFLCAVVLATLSIRLLYEDASISDSTKDLTGDEQSTAAKKHAMWLSKTVEDNSATEARVTHSTNATRSYTKSVVILTYQRSGSTYFGGLFNSDPNAFYVFEPLDGLYSSLYGTAPGWNIPSDIFGYSSGSERTIPEYELKAVADYLADLLSCEISRLPTEALAHKFWKDWRLTVNSTQSYADCLIKNNLVMASLSRHMHNHCGRRFGQRDPERTKECHRLLNDEDFRRTFSKKTLTSQFIEYRRYTDNVVRPRLDRLCSPLLHAACSKQTLRVAKVVRATMESMEQLLRIQPNVQVIHLVRDPRAVALSRRDYYPSARGLFAEDASKDSSELMIREASVLCRRVAGDVRVGRQLQRLFPGRLLTLTYEQLVEEPVRWANEVYRFIGMNEAPKAAVERFGQESNGESKDKSARFLASRWLNDRISRDEFDKINARCADVLAFFPQFASSRPTVFRTQSPSPIYPKRPRVVPRPRRF